MHSVVAEAGRVVLVRFDPGEDLLTSLETAAQQQHLTNAAIVSGVGSLDRFRVHVVETVNMPPGNIFFGEEGPFDILALTGLIVDGKVHAHLTLSNPAHAQGGHLETGCRVLTFAALVLLDLSGISLSRWDERGPLGSPVTSPGE